MNRFTIGLDLGQVSDPTALSTLDERLDLKTVQSPEEAMLGAKGKKIYSRSYHLRQLERPPLGTSYPEIVRWIQDIVNNPILAGQTDLVVDATGVGRPVIQIMQEAGLNPIPVVITFGEIGKDVVMGDDGYFRVPKVDIMASLQVLFGSSRLRYPEVIYDRQGVNLVPVWLHEMEQDEAHEGGEHDLRGVARVRPRRHRALDSHFLLVDPLFSSKRRDSRIAARSRGRVQPARSHAFGA
jgi:hypothetical protein